MDRLFPKPKIEFFEENRALSFSTIRAFFASLLLSACFMPSPNPEKGSLKGVLFREYTVGEGEDLDAISESLGIPRDFLASLNNEDKVRPGETITVPYYKSDKGYESFAFRSLASKKQSLKSDSIVHINLPTSKFLWPIVGGDISSGFGRRTGSFHEGVDIKAAKGTPVYAAHNGEVVFSGWGVNGYGKIVVIKGDGYATVYGHNSEIRVSAGDRVRKGELIANVGSTGRATGNHLHFEIRAKNPNGYVAVDPISFFASQNRDTERSVLAKNANNQIE